MKLFGGTKKKNRLETRIGEFRAWWLGSAPDVRARNEARLANVAGIARAILEDAGGEGFGEKTWEVLFAAGTAYFAFGTTPAELLASLKRGMPEIWPIIEPFLPAHILAEIPAAEARLSG